MNENETQSSCVVNLHSECQVLKAKGETNISLLVLRPSTGVCTVNIVGSHLDKLRSLSRRPRQLLPLIVSH